MDITAKFRCDSKFDRRPEFDGFTVRMSAVYSSDPASENHSWAKATPSGHIDMHINNPDAFDAFERGKEYLVTFAQVVKLLALAFLTALVLAPAASFAQVPDVTPVPAPTLGSQLSGAFFQYLFPTLLAAVGALLSFALAKLAAYLKARTDAVTQGSLSAKGWDSLQRLTVIVQHFVADAETTLRPQFAKALEDGKLTPEEGAALKAAVLDQLKKQVAPELLEAVKAELGGTFEQVLGGLLEGAVAKLGSSSTPAPVDAPPAAKPTAPGTPGFVVP